MKDRVQLTSDPREVVGKKVRHLRADGWVPGVLYGPRIESKNIKMNERELGRVLQQVGGTALIDLQIQGEGRSHTVLAREIQRDILTGRVRHVDFYQVRLDQKVRTSPAINVVGESPIVEDGTAVLIHVLTHVEVECLPADLVSAIDVDISSLQTLADSITVGDLSVPPGITILNDPDDVIMSVIAPRATLEEEEAAAERAEAEAEEAEEEEEE